MANITKITALDGTTYDIRDAQARMYGVHYVEGDTNDTAGTWTGTLENLTAYYNGLTIIYVPKVAGASTTTLNLNNIGAITCYTTNTTKLDTQYTANTPILFTYQDGYWRRADNDVNTTTISNLYHHYANYVADSAIYRYQILFERTEDKLTPLTNANNDTGTSKTMLTNVEFNAFGRIFYYVSATTVEANGSVSAGSLCFAHESFNARYTFNCGTTLTAHKNFYLVVTPTTGNMCTIASSSPWAQELPSTNDGNWYILIGRAYSTYQVSLYPLHPVYMYDGTKVIQVMPNGFTASSMIGATSSADGASGLVPKPVTGDNTKFLCGDGTWQSVSSGGATIDDTAGAGDTDKAWSADKLVTEFGGKANVVSNATSGNFASLNSNGDLTDSGSKASDFLTAHQDISGKADKVSSATAGDFASLDSNGNLTDSGVSASDLAIYATVTNQTIASFDDGADNIPLKSLTVGINPVQDLHGQSNPYPAGGGVNLLPTPVDGTYEANGAKAVVKDGVITLSGTTTSSGNVAIIPLASVVSVPVGAYIHLLNSSVNAGISVGFELASDISSTGVAFTPSPINRIYQNPKETVVTWDRIRIYVGNGVTISGTISPMLCVDSTSRTFAPYSNICPISGHTGVNVSRTGKNLLGYNFESPKTSGGVEYTLNADGSITCAGTTTGTSWGPGNTETILLKAGTYKINLAGATNIRAVMVNASSVPNSAIATDGGVFTLEKDTLVYAYIRSLTGDSGVVINETIYMQLEIGSTTTEYEKYQGSTYPITWETAAGTVYGGTLDVVNGVLTVDRKYMLLDDPDKWQTATGTTTIRYNTGASDRKVYSDSFSGVICSYAVVDTYAEKSARWAGANSTWFGFRGFDNLTLEQVKTDASAGKIAILYELAEAVTYQLSAQQISSLLGQNRLWASTGNVNELTYYTDNPVVYELANLKNGKADKVSGATSGNFAGLDSNGNLVDSGKKASDFDVSTMTGATSSVDGASGLVPKPVAGDNTKFLRGDGTWQTVSGGGGANIDDTAGAGDTDKAWSADKLTTEFGGKADKVSNATNNHFAALDSNGNLKDSGKKASDFASSSIVITDNGIVVNGNTSTSNIKKGNYVTVKNSTISGISNGLYISKANITAGTAVTSGNLTSVSIGGLNSLVDMIYPVGSIYMSFNSTMPAYLTAGKTWTAITAGYVLKTVTSGTGGDLTAAGKTGGTTLTVDQIPSHTHVYGDYWNLSAGSDKKAVAWNSITTNQGGKTIATGGGGSHNHTAGMPANVAIYMWQRTA